MYPSRARLRVPAASERRPVSTTFAEASSCERLAHDRWRAYVDESWLQGRAVFGGMQSAIALRCLRALVPEVRTARTLNVHFCGPCAPGQVDVEARVAREGRRVSCVVGRLSQGGESVAEVTATFGEDREHWLALEGPPSPALAPPSPTDFSSDPGIPQFSRHFEMDLQVGRPYTGAQEARVAGWVRFRRPTAMDEALLAALADCWPPAAVAMMPAPRPAASVDLSIQLHRPGRVRREDPSGFFAFQAISSAACGGYAEELGGLWLPGGQFVGRIRQLRAIY